MISDTKIDSNCVTNDMEFDDGDEITGDDWILVNTSSARPDLSIFNTTERIARATLDIKSSPSVALLIGRGNDSSEKVTL